MGGIYLTHPPAPSLKIKGRGERDADQNELPPLIFKGRAGEGLILY
jgi:hypothetical protein